MSVSGTVSYQYADGSANTIRRTGTTYPNGRQVSLLYSDGADDQLSRVTALANSPLATGLRSYWTLDENVSSGMRYDSLGGNDLSDYNSNVSSAAGKIGRAAQFTAASSAFLNRHPTRSNLLLNGQDFTTCGWIKFNSISTAHDNGIWGKGNSGNNAYTQQEWVFVVSGGNLYWITSNGTTNTIVDPSFYPMINTWYFFSAGYDATSAQGWCRIYDNGTVHSATHSGPGPTDRGNGFTIGRSMDNFLDGWVDAVGVWGRVLSTTELDALYNSNNGYDLQIHAKYTYLGLNTPVQVDYPQPQVKYDLAISDGMGDKYTGLDRFGRVFNNLWQDYNSTPVSAVELHYGYDRASNRLWREDAVSKSLTTPKYFDEFYSYDGLYRLTEMQRGQLTGSPPSGVTNKNFQQDWSLDKTGNWQGFTEAATGGSNTLVQSRAANPVNEITDITNTTGDAWSQPGYDAAGNMTTIPQPADMTKSYVATYDAWNRLRKLVDATTSQVFQENQYDGMNRRAIRHNYGSGFATETRHFYYSDSWQVLEERVDDATYTPDRQFIWGLRYIDDLILRDRSFVATLDERLYALQDANWNVVGFCNDIGAMQQRIAYSPYGLPTWLNIFFDGGSDDFQWETLYCGYRWDGRDDGSYGLYQVRNRYLHSLQGGWITIDAIGFASGQVNLLAYVASPISSTDPSGNERHHWFMRLGGKGQDMVDKLCSCFPSINIDDYTTEYTIAEHRWIHAMHGYEVSINYEGTYRGLLESAANCCEFLIGAFALMSAWHLALQLAIKEGQVDRTSWLTQQAKAANAPPVKSGMPFDLISYNTTKQPPVSNVDTLISKITEACGVPNKPDTYNKYVTQRKEYLDDIKDFADLGLSPTMRVVKGVFRNPFSLIIPAPPIGIPITAPFQFPIEMPMTLPLEVPVLK